MAEGPPPSSAPGSSVLLAGALLARGPFCWPPRAVLLAGCSLWWNSFSGTMWALRPFSWPEYLTNTHTHTHAHKEPLLAWLTRYG